MTAASDTRSHRFYMLDLFRFIAAVLVMVGHTPYHLRLLGFDHTYLAVDFFFVLSGFILSWRYYDQTQFNYGSYALARFARLWPLNIFALLLAIAGIMRGHMTMPPLNPDTSIGTFLMNVFFLQGAGLGAEASFDTPSWTVASEFWINLIFPLLFMRLRLVAFGIAIFLYLVFIRYFETLNLWGPPQHGVPTVDLMRCFAGFACGVVTFSVYKAAHKIRISFLHACAHELFVIAFGALYCMYCLVPGALSFLSIPLFMLAVYVFGRQEGFISLAVKPAYRGAIFLGGISYAVYLLHVPVANLLSINGTNGPSLVVYAGAVILISSLTYIGIEKPAKHWVRKAAARLLPVFGFIR